MADLRIGSTVRAAYGRVAADWSTIGRLALFGAAGLTALDVVRANWLSSGSGGAIVTELIVDAMIAYFVHRIVLMDSPGTAWNALKATKSQIVGAKLRYGKFMVLFGGFYMIMVIVTFFAVALSSGLTATSILIIAAAIVGLSIVFTRISFAFPALAIQEESGVAQAWRETAGNGFRLYVIYACQVIPFLVFGFGIAFVGKLIVPGESATAELIIGFVIYVLRYVGLGVLVAMISLSYRTVVQPAAIGSTEEIAAVFD